MYIDWDLSFLVLLPFIKSVCNYKTPILFKGSLERLFLCDSLYPGINHFIANREILCPVRYKPPMAFHQLLNAAVIDNDYVLCRRNVVAWLGLKRRAPNIKIVGDFPYGAASYKTPVMVSST